MKRGVTFKLLAALLVYTNLLPPALLLAETAKPAGVVAALKGDVLITRASLPQQSRPLKFKDEVFFHDRITTKEQSLVRVLMGGKALITVRELSDLTITEEPGKPSLVDLAKGKIGLAVARARMSPGESIEVRTPNAVAAVRGTVIVVEVIPAAGAADATPDYRPARTSFTGQATPVQAPNFMTNFHVLKGNINVTSLGQPGSAPVNIGAGLSVGVVGGNVGKPYTSPPVQQLVKGLQADPQHKGTPEETNKTIATNSLNTATDLAKIIFNGPPPIHHDPIPEPTPPPTNTILPTTGCTTDCPGSTTTTTTTTSTSNPPLVTITSSTFTLGNNLASVSTGTTTTVPAAATLTGLSGTQGPLYSAVDGTDVAGPVALSGGIKLINTTVTGAGHNVFSVNSGAKATISGTAVELVSSSNVSVGCCGNVLFVGGSGASLTGTTSSPLISVDNSTLTTAFSLLDNASGGTVTLGGPLFSASNNSTASATEFGMRVKGGTLTSSSSATLVSLTSNSRLTVSNDGLLDIQCCGSSVSVAGNLLDASGGGNLVVGQSGVININSDTHSLANGSGKSMFNVSGTATTAETDPDASGLTVGTERPIRGTGTCPTCPVKGSLISASSATVTTNQAVKIDTALLEASAPLVNLFALTNSTMTSNSDFVKLVANAKMNIVPSDALLKLSNSTLNVTGSLFNVAGGSFLKVTRNLFSLDNGSAINITNGALVTVAGGSVFKLTGGSLGLFGAMGTNTLTITNPSLVCAGNCVSLGGSSFQALLVNGAVAGNVTSAGFTPFGGAGPINVNVNGATTGNRPVLVVDGATSRVKLGP